MRSRTDPFPTPKPALIAGVYLLLGAAWIFVTDLFASQIGSEPWIQTAKGMVYIVLTGALLYGILAAYRRRAREAARTLSESESRFRQLAENVREVFWLTDVQTSEVLYVSPAYEEIWGESRERLVGSPGRWTDSVHPDDRRRVLAALTGQVHGEYDLIYRIVRNESEIRWIRDRAFPIRDAEGRVQRIAGLAEDVTEHRRVEEGLRETRDTLQAVIDAAPVAIVALDIEGRVTMWNPAAERIFGYTADEAEGRVPPLVQEEKVGEYRGLLERALAGTRHEGIEIRRCRKDGQELDLLLYTAPTYGWDGEVTGAAAALLDVTERKALEEQLRQAAKMEAIGRLAGGIAHDFNNLLTAIGGYADLLLSEEDPPSEWIEEIRGASAQAARLTSQLLAFSRRQVVNKTSLDVGQVIREMEAILARMIGERMDLSIDLADDLGWVVADRGQLEQVVMNLVVNARDALPNGGSIQVTAENRTLDAGGDESPDPGEFVRLAVTDTGDGMSAETMERAFEPFFSTKGRGKGTGLGLATVYGIARQAGGDARIESAPGEGTTVEVLLPRAVGEAPMEEAAPAREPRGVGGGGERILVVEDDDRVRQLAARILVARGYVVRTARTLEEARSAVDDTIDLLLTDVILPDGSGEDLARELHREDPSLRVVFMSGYPDLDTFHSSGFSERVDFEGSFLQKPFSAADLATRIRETLDLE